MGRCTFLSVRDSERTIERALGAVVRRSREARGVSQDQLAEVCELDRTYISAIERGLRNVSLNAVRQIAEGLDLSFAQLLRQIADEVEHG